jgi:hypothetical protein
MVNGHEIRASFNKFRINISAFLEREMCVTLVFWLLALGMAMVLKLFNRI